MTTTDRLFGTDYQYDSMIGNTANVEPIPEHQDPARRLLLRRGCGDLLSMLAIGSVLA